MNETVARYPDTLLGSESMRNKYYLEDREEVFLERNRLIFRLKYNSVKVNKSSIIAET